MAVGGGVADIFLARPGNIGKARLQRGDHAFGFIDRQSRLGAIGKIALVGDDEGIDAVGILKQDDGARRQLPHRTVDLGVAAMADEYDLPALGIMPLSLAMHLADQRAGGVERVQSAPLRVVGHGLGHAVGGEDHGRAFGHLVQLIDEQGALGLELFDHEAIMDDLVADIDRRTRNLERPLDNLDSAIDPGAKAARPGEDDGERWQRHV